ncbi:class I SAM-dependent methyltransferase [Candidatus Pantoea formicae]|uniref:class I SAM-dependent methyltransferase n=1 Tax=Candidatus Pantoea formicae TaxID=2608355 RepID=UPI003ED85D7D
MHSTLEVSMKLKKKLEEDGQGERHALYHVLPEFLNAELMESGCQNIYRFNERERFSFFKQFVDFKGKSVLDIGCNTGYFMFSVLDEGANQITGYEGKKSCVNFIMQAKPYCSHPEKIHVLNEYYDFSNAGGTYDVCLLLNVLHHLGDDFGDDEINKDEAKKIIIEHLRFMSHNVDTLIFQMGYNWKGEHDKCLFADGTKQEMIEFLQLNLAESWEFVVIGIAERSAEGIRYCTPSENNIQRDDELREFLNRPIFILKSKKFNTTNK